MTMILLATSLAGVLTSKALLVLGMNNVAIRYPVTVIIAYGVFFLSIKIWLWLVTDPRPPGKLETGVMDPSALYIPMPSGESSLFNGAGGSFDGGGASGYFDDAVEGASDTGNVLSGAGDVVGDVVGSATDDEGGLVLVIVLGLLALLLFSVLGA